MDKKDEPPKPPSQYPPAPPRMEPEFDLMNLWRLQATLEGTFNPNGEKEWEALKDQLIESALKNMFNPKK